MSEPASFSPEERERLLADRIRAHYETHRLRNTPDEHGITPVMVDKMMEVWAEGLSTGGNNIRSLFYCAYREARKMEKPNHPPSADVNQERE